MMEASKLGGERDSPSPKSLVEEIPLRRQVNEVEDAK